MAMAKGERRAELASIEDLRPAPYNDLARTITDEAAAGLRASIQRFGDISKITFNRRSGTLVCGHKRVEQLKALGAELDVEAKSLVMPSGERFDIRVVDWDLGDEMAANFSANNPHVAGDFTSEAPRLLAEARELIGDVGFNALQLPSLEAQVAEFSQQHAGESSDDDNAVAGDPQDRFAIIAREVIAERAFRYYRATGFPYPEVPIHMQMQEVNAIARAINKRTCSAVGLKTCDNYHRHRFDCKVEGKRTVVESFNRDASLSHALQMTLESSVVSDGIPQFISVAQGAQGCANFRPSVAGILYRRFAKQGGYVLDPCMGWGGRMLGWFASNIGGKYVACDPSTCTHAANVAMARALNIQGAELHCVPFEDFEISQISGRCSFAFTSPPYFSKERYANEGTQSFVRYQSYQDWRDGFLSVLLSKMRDAVAPGCCVIVNIDDVKIGSRGETYPLVADTVDAALACGLRHVANETLNLPSVGQGDQDSSEPVLLFDRPT